MKAMILAAGRGERLRPITDTCPKPLVKVGGKELLVWHIEKLKQVGITDILINSAYLSEKIVDFIGDGSTISGGGDAFNGRITDGPLPLIPARLISFQLNSCFILSIDIDGTMKLRNVGDSITVPSTSGVYMCGSFLIA